MIAGFDFMLKKLKMRFEILARTEDVHEDDFHIRVSI